MIHNKEMKHSEFNILRNYILVKPKELNRGELKDGEIIIAMDQNESINDRPTTGIVLSVGPEVEEITKDYTVLWVEQDGLEIEFSDGVYLLLKETSI